MQGLKVERVLGRVKRNFHAKERKKKRELKAQAKGSSSHDAGRGEALATTQGEMSTMKTTALWLTTDEG